MLVLARRINESIMIGDQIEVSIIDIRGEQVKIGIQAPSQVKVYRQEVYRAIQEENLPQQAAEKGFYLLEHLNQLESPLVREVRGLGLMIGIELKQKVAPYLQKMESRGVIALPAGMTVIRLLPPLVISYAQLDQVLAVLAEVLNPDGGGA